MRAVSHQAFGHPASDDPPLAEAATGYDYRASPRDRAITYVLTVLIGAAFVWMLILLGVVPSIVRRQENKPIIVQMVAGAHKSAVKQKADGANSAATKAKPRPTREPPHQAPPPPPVQKPPTPQWNVIPLTGQDFAQSDISKKPSAPTAAPAAQVADSGSASGAARGTGHGSTYGPSDGSDGIEYGYADWYRQPSGAEMLPYFPDGHIPEGYGVIACKTAPDYHVESCKQLSETPGSGIARAMRQAAGQFRVLPPRVNGRPIIGAWIRIRWTEHIIRSGGSGSGSNGPDE